MFSKTGWYQMNGKAVFVQRLGSVLQYWTSADGWDFLTEDQEKIIIYTGKSTEQ